MGSRHGPDDVRCDTEVGLASGSLTGSTEIRIASLFMSSCVTRVELEIECWNVVILLHVSSHH